MNRYVCALGLIAWVAMLGTVAAHPGRDVLGCHNGTTATVDECCAIPMLANKSIIGKCKPEKPFKKPSNKDEKGQRANHGACIAECIMKNMGALKNDEINEAGFRKAIEPVVKANPAFAKLIDETVKKCYEGINFDAAFTRSPPGTEQSCKPVAKGFINCVYGNLFEQCPTSVWTNKDGCALLKEKMNKGCPYFALRRHGGRRMRPT